jgi:hypothetical protein
MTSKKNVLKNFALSTMPSSLLTPVQFTANPRRERTLPLTQGVGSPRPICCHVPLPPPHRGGEGGSSADPSGRSKLPATPSRTPRHLTSPSLGSESGPAVQDGTAALPAAPSLAPRGSAPPSTGRGLGAGRPAGTASTALLRPPSQYITGIGSNSPSWADVVRTGQRLSPSPPADTTVSSASTTADFLALYERCISNGLKTRINMNNSAGVQEIILTCHISSSLASARRRRRRRRPRRRGPAVSAAALTRTSPPPPLLAPSSTRPEPPPPVPPAPEHSPLQSPTIQSPPPTKRTRKAVKRRCEVELLRGVDMEDDLSVTPPLFTPPPARSPLTPSPTPTVSPTTEQSPSFSETSQFPAIHPAGTPDHSASALSTMSTPPTSPESPSSPPLAVQVISTPISPAPVPAPSTNTSTPTTSGLASSPPPAAPERSSTASTAPATSEPPPPPPWPEGYIFSTDPDRIICRYCCKRHYNYKWYSHCYLCHTNENKS